LFFVVGDIISEVGLRQFWLRLPGPGHQLLEGIFWLLVFRALDRLSSISGSVVMADKQQKVDD